MKKTTEIKKITVAKSFDPEDPRIHTVNGEFYITYNDEPFAHIHKKNETSNLLKRRMYVGKLNIEQASLQNIHEVPSGGIPQTPREKNWMPFEYPEKNGDLHYIYNTFPYAIIKVKNSNNQLLSSVYNTKSQLIYNIWERHIWGSIKGGTPARLIDDVYLTFFHAWHPCPDGKNYYYVMGAYTFEAKPPFRILQVTPNPVLFKEAYSANHRTDNVHTVYPSGFAIEKQKEKTTLHISCGENDTSTRIVSIDWKTLLQDMVSIS